MLEIEIWTKVLLLGVVASYFIGGLLCKWLISKYNYAALAAILFSVLNLVLSGLLIVSSAGNMPQELNYQWFSLLSHGVLGDIHFSFGFLLDPLSIWMLALIAIISPLVILYSNYYLKSIGSPGHYWWKLMFFCGTMQVLVLSNNLLQLFMAWELVGFSSYLLINFYQSKMESRKASLLAFLNNKVGDVFLLAGILILWIQFRSFNFHELGLLAGDLGGRIQLSSISSEQWVSTIVGTTGALFLSLPAWTLPTSGILIAIGALAKSAQFPLSAWLPRAMVAPTPISSLLHAATMVTAGVFLLARVYPLFTSSVLLLIAIIGVATALLFAISAGVQRDIKKVLAHSTISQLGFMVTAIGVGAYIPALTHLASHAFFKCLLFLCAGIIIITYRKYLKESKKTGDAQDLDTLRGSAVNMPWLKAFFVVSSASLIGLPLFSGFLSKDAILESLLFRAQESDQLAYLLIAISGVIAVFFTAFYVARLYLILFDEKFKNNAVKEEKHWNWMLPFGVLGLLCFFPFLSWNPLHFSDSWVFNFLSPLPSIFIPNTTSLVHGKGYILPLLIFVISLIGVWRAYKSHHNNRIFNFNPEHVILKNWGLSLVYRFITKVFGFYPAKFLSWFEIVVLESINKAVVSSQKLMSYLSLISDKYLIDGIVNLSVGMVQVTGKKLVAVQKGTIQYYFLWMLVVLIILFLIILKA